ncbi:MAG: LuxR C-terminal-related transcriptional regulator [Acidobacteriota bacterium]
MTWRSRKTNLVRNLTEREKQVLKLLADGYSNEETAKALLLSRRTVEAHRARIMIKLQLHDLPALVKYAIRSGLCNVQEHRNYEVKPTVSEEVLAISAHS